VNRPLYSPLLSGHPRVMVKQAIPTHPVVNQASAGDGGQNGCGGALSDSFETALPVEPDRGEKGPGNHR
jgi:hypothetical protein